jgi:hypothetical protein
MLEERFGFSCWRVIFLQSDISPSTRYSWVSEVIEEQESIRRTASDKQENQRHRIKAWCALTSSFVYTVDHSLEAPEIQLSLKGLVLCLSEEHWKDIRNELVLVVHLEGATIGKPRHNVFESIMFGVGQHGVHFPREVSIHYWSELIISIAAFGAMDKVAIQLNIQHHIGEVVSLTVIRWTLIFFFRRSLAIYEE